MSASCVHLEKGTPAECKTGRDTAAAPFFVSSQQALPSTLLCENGRCKHILVQARFVFFVSQSISDAFSVPLMEIRASGTPGCPGAWLAIAKTASEEFGCPQAHQLQQLRRLSSASVSTVSIEGRRWSTTLCGMLEDFL